MHLNTNMHKHKQRSMPNMPLVFIHVALTPKVASSVQALIKHHHKDSESQVDNGHFNADDVTTAVFYSISSTQPGITIYIQMLVLNKK